MDDWRILSKFTPVGCQHAHISECENMGAFFGIEGPIAWIILLVPTQQTVTNLVRSGRKQR